MNVNNCSRCGRFIPYNIAFCAGCKTIADEAALSHFRSRFDGLNPVNIGEGLNTQEFLIISSKGDWMIVSDGDVVEFKDDTINVKNDVKEAT